MSEQITRKIAVYTDKSSNKYWILEINKEAENDYRVRMSWGRIGTINAPKEEKYDNKIFAQHYGGNKFRRKISEGYREVSENEFRLLTAQAKLIGTKYKIRILQFVQVTSTTPNEDYVAMRPLTDQELIDPSIEPKVLCIIQRPDGVRQDWILMSDTEVKIATINATNNPFASSYILKGQFSPIHKHSEYDNNPSNYINKIEKNIDNIVSTLFDKGKANEEAINSN